MQSSAGGVFRALVMLACLVAIPLVALWGTSLPDLVKKWLNTRPGVASAPESKPLADAPKLQANVSTLPRDGTPSGPTLGAWPASPESGVRWPEEVAGRGGGVRPAAFHEPDSPAGLSPVVQGTPAPPLMSTPTASLTSPPGVQPSPQAIDRFLYVQQRLRTLGATYYLLESWGSRGDYYRFQCKMPIGGNSTAVRYFEATDTDSLQAMSKVLEDVEAWKSGSP